MPHSQPRYWRHYAGGALFVVLAAILALQAMANARIVIPLNQSWNGFRMASLSLVSVGMEEGANGLPEFSVSPEGLALARRAYAREPLATDALFVGVIGAGQDSAEGRDLVETAIAIDRRNSNIGGLQLQRAALAQDVPETLAILSRLTVIKPDLAPSLVQALLPVLADANSVSLIGRGIAQDDVLAEAFWARAPMNPAGLANLVELRRRVDNGTTEATDRYLLRTLIDNGHYADGFAIWRAYVAGPESDRETGFSRGAEDHAIDWTLNEDSNLNMRPLGDGEFGVYVRRERRGELGRQLLELAPGRYRLDVESDSSALTDSLRIALQCATQESPDEGITLTEDRNWTVGQGGCRHYWLVIGADSWNVPVDLQGRLSDMALVRLQN